MTILEPLRDVQLSEGQDAHFQCRLSRACSQEARWTLGGVPLQANEMNDITVEHGTLHSLTLHKVGRWDLPPSIHRLPGVWRGRFQLHLPWAGDLPAEIVGMGYQAETPSLLPQVTLEDSGTISFQVGSCSSEAQLKVTGGQPPPTPSDLLGMSPCPYSWSYWGVVRPETQAVSLPWGVNFPTPDC